ncbi:sulfotransferase family 2 domain-containing protein [Histidinibacterium lentulum]|uniref:Sulfotransferase family protein n=1 Tax=Histidinibacterium lentulum TaxID=2480588 RepID=A0A3N2R7F5_9RHOB|nr:sulfotransferase family 2 domain-containing protein [Histidinibacterium lentulum]ROU03409.1 hypothetical protein EAT49_03630 [Histidinibacterium lentulum]
MFVFAHIPKTAGTALGHAFDFSSARRVFWDYDPEYRYARAVQPEISENIGFIGSYYRVIFGHFFVTKYRTLLPDAVYLTCIRHPVDRVVSQYYHLAADGRSWQGRAIQEGRMDVVDFARSDNIGNAQKVHLDGVSIRDMDHVFLTERLHESMKAFTAKFSFDFSVRAPRVNTRANREASLRANTSFIDVTESHRKKVFGLCAEDVDLYREAVDRHTAERLAYF